MKFDKQAALVSRLYKATNESKLDWRPSPVDDAVMVSFPNYTVVLSKTKGDNYLLDLVNDAGETADSFYDTQLDSAVDLPPPPIGGLWHHTMRETYAMAKRRASGSDQALDDILKELGE